MQQPNIYVATASGDGSQTAQPSVSSRASTTSILQPPCDGYSRSATYCRHLLEQQRGFPLFVPGPEHLPPESQTTGVSIGDVGQVTPEGMFDVFFNIFLSRDHPINVDAPQDFTPLAGYDDYGVISSNFPPGPHVSGVSATARIDETVEFPGGDFTSSCHGPDGAILCLPNGSRMERLRNVQAIRRYAAANAESWYRYVEGTLGSRLVNGELYLITGCEKASSWGITTFHGLSAQNRFPVSFGPVGDNYAYRWKGPHCHRKQADGSRPNQTLFIHGFKLFVAKRLFGVEVRRSGGFLQVRVFGGRKENGQGPALGDGLAIEVAPIGKIWHPSEAISSAIFQKVPEATVVIIHDDDWCDVFKPESSENIWDVIFSTHEIILDDIMVFLKKKPASTTDTTTLVVASASTNDSATCIA
ncbi:hypothetical protein C8R45DRAFT_1213800 [Mycena sanguinolenta]|nr:hypothetical protein C8R45DRAFT_1213800 [Mycena sanguinolenta]